jgi:hypothetical protein
VENCEVVYMEAKRLYNEGLWFCQYLYINEKKTRQHPKNLENKLHVPNWLYDKFIFLENSLWIHLIDGDLY